MEGVLTQMRAFSECFQRLRDLQHRCKNGSSVWSTGEQYRWCVQSSVQYTLWTVLMSAAYGLCTCVNLAISICQPDPIRTSNKKKSPLCSAKSLAACRRLLLFPVCQVAEPIAFSPGLIQIASSASLHAESVSVTVNRSDCRNTCSSWPSLDRSIWWSLRFSGVWSSSSALLKWPVPQPCWGIPLFVNSKKASVSVWLHRNTSQLALSCPKTLGLFGASVQQLRAAWV